MKRKNAPLTAFTASTAFAASALVLSASFVTASGQPAPGKIALPKPTYHGHCDKTAETQLALDECVGGQVAELTSEMQKALSDEVSQFGAANVARVQNSWSAFEKAECSLEESPYKGGTIQPLIYGTCERGLLVQRIDEIDAVVAAVPH